MGTDIKSVENFLKLLRESQLRIDTLLEKIDAQQLTDCPKVKSKIQGELAEQFAKQISTKRTLFSSEEFQKCDLSLQQQFTQYPNFRQWLKSIELRHLLNVSLESNIESLESLFSTPWEKVKVIAQTCGASDTEISTLYNGLRVLRSHLDASATGTGAESSLHESSTPDFDTIFKSPSQSSTTEQCAATVRRCSSLENPDDLAYKLYGRPRRKKTFEKPGEMSDDGYGTQTSVDRFLPLSTAGAVAAAAQHNFVTKKFNITSIGHCAVCNKFLVSGLRCAHCRYKCHKKCAHRVTERCQPILSSTFSAGGRSGMSTSQLMIDIAASPDAAAAAAAVSRSQTLSDKAEFKGHALPSTIPSKKSRTTFGGGLGGPNFSRGGIYCGSSTWHPAPHSKSIPLVSDDSGGGTHCGGGGGAMGSMGSSSSRIFMGGGGMMACGAVGGGGTVGTGVCGGGGGTLLHDSSTGGSCSSSFLALSTNELPSMTSAHVSCSSGSSRQRGRFSSSTTAASSDVSSSVESSPSHLKGGPGAPLASSASGGASTSRIFTFSPPQYIPDNESGVEGSQGEYQLAVPAVPHSAPYIGHHASSTAPLPQTAHGSYPSSCCSSAGGGAPATTCCTFGVGAVGALRLNSRGGGRNNQHHHHSDAAAACSDKCGVGAAGVASASTGHLHSHSGSGGSGGASAYRSTSSSSSHDGGAALSVSVCQQQQQGAAVQGVGVGTNESSSVLLDSDGGVTISRESGENTSTTLTDSENATSSTTQKEKMSVGEFERRMDDDYDEIQSLHDVRLEKLLGRGKFATVYRGYWHGEVALKLYHHQQQTGPPNPHPHHTPGAHCAYPLSCKSGTNNSHNNSSSFSGDPSPADPADEGDSRRRGGASGSVSVSVYDTDIITKDIKTLCKARHNNIVLFMAACRNPPAIITSLCKGKTLYKKVHLIREEMSMLSILHILEQVAQGMGYLHGRLIIHKDLRSKNIFVDERQHVTITDYGLANITKVVRNSPSGDISIYCPVGWLSYLAPELIRALRPSRSVDQTMPFSMETDVYAFGSVCYELMSGRFLYQNMHCQTIIWIIASGCRKSLGAFQSSKIMKDFLLKIWNFNPDNRPLFSQIHSDLREVERKICSEKPSLDRYPSQPITVSRSMERINVAF